MPDFSPSYLDAIGQIESGGNYGLLGPPTHSGDRAYGKYQVMGNNIPDWTQETLGFKMTPKQFLASPEAQDAVFQGKFGQALNKYGNPQDAASVWFSGRPLAQAANASDGYIKTSEYVDRFNKALGSPTRINVPVSFAGNESPTFNAPGAPVPSQAQNNQQQQQLPGVAGAGSGSPYPQFPNAPNVGFLQLPQLPPRRPLNLSNIQALLPMPLPTMQSLLQRG